MTTKLIHIIEEYSNNGYNSISIVCISLLAVLCCILTIVSKNPVISVLYLIGLFLGVSIYLIMLGFTFIGLSYLLVYIGAISILFLFIVMLINIRTSELINNTLKNIFLGLIISIVCIEIFQNLNLINNSIVYGIFDVSFREQIIVADVLNNFWISFKYMNHYFYQGWENNFIHFPSIGYIGNLLYSYYSIWLIIVSIILLVAMIGAIVITIKSKKKEN